MSRHRGQELALLEQENDQQPNEEKQDEGGEEPERGCRA